MKKKSELWNGILAAVLSATLLISSLPTAAYANEKSGMNQPNDQTADYAERESSADPPDDPAAEEAEESGTDQPDDPAEEAGGEDADQPDDPAASLSDSPQDWQLVPNSGFESGTAGQLPDNWSVADGSDIDHGSAVINEDPSGVNYGAYSLKLSYQGSGIYAVMSDPMPVTAGEKLRVNVLSKKASGSGNYQAYLNYYDEDGQTVGTSRKYGTSTSNGWSYVTTNTKGIDAAVIPAGAVTARYVFSLGAQGDQTDVGFYLDRATVIRLDPSVAAVPNGGFEEGSDESTGFPVGYDVWEWTDNAKGTVELTTEDAYKGQYSVKLSTTEGTGQNSIRSALVAVEPGVSYDFNAYTYAASGGNPVVRAYFYTGDGAELSLKDTTSNVPGAWVRTKNVATAPENAAFASVIVYQYRSADTVTYVDEISIIKTSDDAEEEPLSSALLNPGFEDTAQTNGLPSNWKQWPSNAAGKYVLTTAMVHSGNGYNGTRSLELVDDSDQTAGIASDPVQVNADKKIRASAWVYNQSGSGIVLYLNFYETKEDAMNGTNRIASPLPNSFCSAPGQWTFVTAEGVAPEDATCATVGFYSGTDARTDSFLDDANLTEISEHTYPDAILNAGFEDGAGAGDIPNHWVKLNAANQVSLSGEQHYEGNYSVKLVNDSPRGCGLRSSKVAVTPGVTYEAKAKMYCAIGSADLYLEFWSDADSRISTKTATISQTKQWCDIYAIMAAPAGATYATLLYYQNSGEQGIVYGDCASIEPYVPPAGEVRHFTSIIKDHPKVFFTSDDIASLRRLARSADQTATGVTGKEVADQIISQADVYLNETSYKTSFSAYGTTYSITIQNPPVQQPESPDRPAGYNVFPFWTQLSRGIEDHLEILSMAYMLTGKSEYARKAIDFVSAMSGWDLWHDPKDNYPEEQLTNLDTAHLVQGAAMAYDVCYDRMTEAERTKIREAIVTLGLEPLYHDGQYKLDWNIQGLRNAALATGSLAVMDDVDSGATDRYLTCATDFFDWYLDQKQESGNEEGFGYTSYALENIVGSFDQLARVTGETSLIKNSYLNDTLMKWIIHFSAPGSLSLAPVSDMTEGTQEFYQTCSALAKNGNGLAGWYLTHAKLGSSDILLTQKFLFLCNPDSIKITEPGKVLGNSSIIPEVGWGALRTGWGTTDSVLGLISDNSSMGHNHFDQNSFLLATNGTWIADDPGYSTFVSTEQARQQFRGKVGHNTILVNWEKNTDNGAQVFKGGGSLTPNILTSSYGYLIGSAEDSYGLDVLKQFDRHAVMINHDGHPYYVVFDDLDSAQDRTYTWSLFTGGWDAFSVDGRTVEGITSSQTGNLLKINRNATNLYAQFVGNGKLQIDSDMYTVNDQEEGPYIHVSNTQKTRQYQFMAVLNTYASAINIPANIFQPTNVISGGCTGVLSTLDQSSGIPLSVALFRGESGAGSKVTYTFEVPEDGDYAVDLLHPASPAYGIYQMSIDNIPYGKPMDGYSTSVILNAAPFTVGKMHLSAGTHTLTAVCTGTSVPEGNKYLLGITAIRLKKSSVDSSADAPIRVAQTVDDADVLGARLSYVADADDIVLFRRSEAAIENSLGVFTDAKQVSLVGLKKDGTLDGIGVNHATALRYKNKALLASTEPVSAYVDYRGGTVTIQSDKASKITYLDGKGGGTAHTISVNAGTTTEKILESAPSKKDSSPTPIPSAPIQRDTATYISDTTYDLHVDGAYTFRITSKNGKAPGFVVGTAGVFDVALVKVTGSDYFFKITAIGAPGAKAGIYINGGPRLLIATVGSNLGDVRLDTGGRLNVKAGKTYQFRITSAKKPSFVCGTPSTFRVFFNGSDGNDYFFKATATGKVGDSAGFYVNGEKVPRTISTIIN